MSEGNDMQMNQHEFELNNSDVYLHSNQPNGFQGQTDEVFFSFFFSRFYYLLLFQ